MDAEKDSLTLVYYFLKAPGMFGHKHLPLKQTEVLFFEPINDESTNSIVVICVFIDSTTAQINSRRHKKSSYSCSRKDFVDWYTIDLSSVVFFVFQCKKRRE